jgi:HAD superfamily hydrolase (TIGR01509 family)
VKFELDQFKNYNGVDSKTFLREAFPLLTHDDIEKVRIVKTAVYPKFVFETKLNYSLIEFLISLKSITRRGIVTNATRVSVEAVLDFHKINGLFDFLVTGDDVKNPKPDVEPYLLGIKKLELDRGEILVFEDSQIGIESATSAELMVVRTSIQEESN